MSAIQVQDDMIFVYDCCNGKPYTAGRWRHVHHNICSRMCLDHIMKTHVSIEQLINVPLCLSQTLVAVVTDT